METKMKVPITPITPDAPAEVSEVEIKRIVILPEKDVLRIHCTAGDKAVHLEVAGAEYAAVVAEVDLPKLTTMLQGKVEAGAREALAQ